ncbi:MAG: DNA-binding protein WhiA [Clostridia bacterium]|nr:DNA-binding protein WhiA [Clostridia bacterium]
MSFSSDTKTYLCERKPKHDCCRASLLYGILFGTKKYSKEGVCFSTENGKIAELTDELFLSCLSFPLTTDITKKRDRLMYNMSVPAEYTERVLSEFPPPPELRKGLFKCAECEKAFIRGVFISAGFIYPPPQCRVEICLPSREAASALSKLLGEMTDEPKVSRKISRSAKEIFTLYYIDERRVEDFLGLIEATQTAFAIMNEKIINDVRNTANRSRNCDAANIQKSVDAALAQTEAVEILKRSGKLFCLPEKLVETALLRSENPTADLSELASLHDPPISKSGVSHRLAKLVEASKSVKEKQ